MFSSCENALFKSSDVTAYAFLTSTTEIWRGIPCSPLPPQLNNKLMAHTLIAILLLQRWGN